MATENSFQRGDKVRYIPHIGPPENGIVKSVQDDEHVFVVYACTNDWDNYFNYTAARTEIRHLKKGWI